MMFSSAGCFPTVSNDVGVVDSSGNDGHPLSMTS